MKKQNRTFTDEQLAAFWAPESEKEYDTVSEDELGEGGKDDKVTPKVRQMKNGDFVIPYSVAFVLKKFENFDTKRCTMDVKMTMILRIKLDNVNKLLDADGLKMCKSYLRDGINLKIMVNNDEMPLVCAPMRSGILTESKSTDHVKDTSGDIIQYTLRLGEKFKTSFMDFESYPFDQPMFKFKFEICSFEKKVNDEKYQFRFDFYEQFNNSITCKETCDKMPELDIDFNGVDKPKLEVLMKYQAHKERSVEGQCKYYPGFTLCVGTLRDPFPKIFRFFFPAIILGFFLYETFDVEEYQDRLANLAIVLLTYIAIMEDMRSQLPEISALTNADRFLIVYIVMCLFPVFDHIVGFGLKNRISKLEAENQEIVRVLVRRIFLFIGCMSVIWTCTKYLLVYKRLNQTPPKQVQEEGGKKCPDFHWKPLQGDVPSWQPSEEISEAQRLLRMSVMAENLTNVEDYENVEVDVQF